MLDLDAMGSYKSRLNSALLLIATLLIMLSRCYLDKSQFNIINNKKSIYKMYLLYNYVRYFLVNCNWNGKIIKNKSETKYYVLIVAFVSLVFQKSMENEH